jgi:hypothetical protein
MGQVNENKTCLLVTGTIVPNSNFVAHKDAAQRRNEYMEALKFYRETMKDMSIYFLENSSYDFDNDKEFMEFLKVKQVNLLKFPVSDKFREGKGYQEFQMLDEAVERLNKSYGIFVKVTGRYKVMNLPRLIAGINGEINIDLQKKFKVAQTNVFICRIEFYQQHIKGLYVKANDEGGMFIEKVIYGKLVNESLLDAVSMFAVNPEIEGVSGSYGGSLKRNPLKMMIRQVERKIFRILGVKQFLMEY